MIKNPQTSSVILYTGRKKMNDTKMLSQELAEKEHSLTPLLLCLYQVTHSLCSAWYVCPQYCCGKLCGFQQHLCCLHLTLQISSMIRVF